MQIAAHCRSINYTVIILIICGLLVCLMFEVSQPACPEKIATNMFMNKIGLLPKPAKFLLKSTYGKWELTFICHADYGVNSKVAYVPVLQHTECHSSEFRQSFH